MIQRNQYLYFAFSKKRGRGIFTAKEISKGDLIEICPVIVLPQEEIEIVHNTKLHDYYFLWNLAQTECAIVLGYGSLYNHSYKPNAEYQMDLENNTMDFYCIKEIEPGEEITINYNGDPGDQGLVWFDKE